LELNVVVACAQQMLTLSSTLTVRPVYCCAAAVAITAILHTTGAALYAPNADVQLASVNDAQHFCARMREGFYDVFYPDQSVLVGDHLNLRSKTAAGVLGSYDYNPLQKNLWAVDYEQSYVQSPDAKRKYLLISIMALVCVCFSAVYCEVLS
jgi:hypothetical protein